MEGFLEETQISHPGLKITKYELKENIDLLLSLADNYNLKLTERIPIPIIFIDNKYFVGYNKEISTSIQQKIEECTNKECISPLNYKDNGKDNLKELTIPVVISAALVDAINPCAFAVLILLITTILATGNRKKALLAGIVFTAAIYISYFMIGIGLYSAISAAGISNIFYIIVASLAIILGLFNLKDYLWYGKWFITEVPRKWRPRMKLIIKKVTSIPGAFITGFLVSLFLLPCTSGPYIVILGLLSKVATRNFAIFLLSLYNFVFILPMLLITLGIYFGFTTTEKAELWRTKKLKTLHLIAGIILLLLGIGMFIAIWLGII